MAVPDVRHGGALTSPANAYYRNLLFGGGYLLGRDEKADSAELEGNINEQKQTSLYGIFPLLRLPTANYATGLGVLAQTVERTVGRQSDQIQTEQQERRFAVQAFLDISNFGLGLRYGFSRYEEQREGFLRRTEQDGGSWARFREKSQVQYEILQGILAYELSEFIRFAISYVPLVDVLYRPKYIPVDDEGWLPASRQRLHTQPEVLSLAVSVIIPNSPLLIVGGFEKEEVWDEPENSNRSGSLALEVDTGFSLPRLGLHYRRLHAGEARRLAVGCDFVMGSLTISIDTGLTLESTRIVSDGQRDIQKLDGMVGLGARI